MTSSRQYRDPYRDANRELPAYEATVIIRRPPRRLRVVTISVIATVSMIMGVLLLLRMDEKPPATSTVLVMRGTPTASAAGAGILDPSGAGDPGTGHGSAEPARPAAGAVPTHRPPRRQQRQPGPDAPKAANSAAAPAASVAHGSAAGAVDELADRPADEQADRPAGSLADGPADRPADDGTGELADKPAVKLAARAAGRSADGPVARSGNRTGTRSGTRPAIVAAGEPARTSAPAEAAAAETAAAETAAAETAAAKTADAEAAAARARDQGGTESADQSARQTGVDSSAVAAGSDLSARGIGSGSTRASLADRPAPTPTVRTPQEIRVPRKMLGNAGRGKGLFGRCQSCHNRKADAIEPSHYTQKQWIRYMASTRHSQHASFAAHFNLAQLADVKAYLLDHAADVNHGRIPGVR